MNFSACQRHFEEEGGSTFCKQASCEAWRQTNPSKHSRGALHPQPEKDVIFSEMPYLLLQSICLTKLTHDVSVNCELVGCHQHYNQGSVILWLPENEVGTEGIVGGGQSKHSY